MNITAVTQSKKDDNSDDGEEIEKSTFRMPLRLMKQLRYLAIDRNTTVTALLIEAVKEYLSKGGGKSKK